MRGIPKRCCFCFSTSWIGSESLQINYPCSQFERIPTLCVSVQRLFEIN